MSSSKFHLSLNVRDIRGTAEFLELLLGVKPVELHCDYAKFELQEPALVLSLVPTDIPSGAGLNHVGFRLANRQALVDMQQRLATAGVAHECQESVACCHSRQTKFWTHDPAGNLWELYVLDESQPASSQAAILAPHINKIAPTVVKTTWAHRLGELFPEAIPATDNSLDEVVLEGTFNAVRTCAEQTLILREAARVLHEGGKIVLRGLTSNHALEQAPRLPGPAVAVEHVPTVNELLVLFADAGFVGMELVAFGETYRFAHAGAELRETRLVAWRPSLHSALKSHLILYRGPFREVHDDSDLVFQRGVAVHVDEPTWLRLKDSACGSQFVLLSTSGFPA